MTDKSIAESITTDMQWIKQLLGWGLTAAGGGLLLLLAVIVYFDQMLHGAILASQLDVQAAMVKSSSEVSEVTNELHINNTRHELGLVMLENRQDNLETQWKARVKQF